MPNSFDELLKLPGVGRKTANVVYDVGFGGDGIPVDTHVFRVSNRLGIAPGKRRGKWRTSSSKSYRRATATARIISSYFWGGTAARRFRRNATTAP